MVQALYTRTFVTSFPCPLAAVCPCPCVHVEYVPSRDYDYPTATAEEEEESVEYGIRPFPVSFFLGSFGFSSALIGDATP